MIDILYAYVEVKIYIKHVNIIKICFLINSQQALSQITSLIRRLITAMLSIGN